MIFLQGWGALVGLIGTVLIGAGLESMTGSRAASYAVAGLALAAFGWWLTPGTTIAMRCSGSPFSTWGC